MNKRIKDGYYKISYLNRTQGIFKVKNNVFTLLKNYSFPKSVRVPMIIPDKIVTTHWFYPSPEKTITKITKKEVFLELL